MSGYKMKIATLIAVLCVTIADARWIWRWRGPTIVKTQIMLTQERRAPENQYTNNMTLTAMDGENFLHFMQMAKSNNAEFEFKCENNAASECVLSEINGVTEDPTQQTTWKFIKRDMEGNDCLLVEGIKTYIPQPDDHLVMSYLPASVSGTISNCQ